LPHLNVWETALEDKTAASLAKWPPKGSSPARHRKRAHGLAACLGVVAPASENVGSLVRIPPGCKGLKTYIYVHCNAVVCNLICTVHKCSNLIENNLKNNVKHGLMLVWRVRYRISFWNWWY
jgi:hypothetical protein